MSADTNLAAILFWISAGMAVACCLVFIAHEILTHRRRDTWTQFDDPGWDAPPKHRKRKEPPK
jgi:hypothetical protein